MSLLYNILWKYWFDNQDPRTVHLPLCSNSPYPVLIIIGLYLWFCLRLGPYIVDTVNNNNKNNNNISNNSNNKIKKNHNENQNQISSNDSYDQHQHILLSLQKQQSQSHFNNNKPIISDNILKPIMLVYNVSMTMFNSFFVVMILLFFDFKKLADFRYPNLTKDSTSAQQQFEYWYINFGWWYWMTKFLDLFDSIFFLLRNKHRTHLTFLHLYHHSVVPIFGYLFLKLNPLLPMVALFGLVNGLVHCIMYSYYAITLFADNSIRRRLWWWKRSITQLQLGQFIIYIFYGLLLVFKQQDYPPFWFVLGLSQPFVFFKLFYDFYSQAYNSDNDIVIISKKKHN